MRGTLQTARQVVELVYAFLERTALRIRSRVIDAGFRSRASFRTTPSSVAQKTVDVGASSTLPPGSRAAPLCARLIALRVASVPSYERVFAPVTRSSVDRDRLKGEPCSKGADAHHRDPRPHAGYSAEPHAAPLAWRRPSILSRMLRDSIEEDSIGGAIEPVEVSFTRKAYRRRGQHLECAVPRRNPSSVTDARSAIGRLSPSMEQRALMPRRGSRRSLPLLARPAPCSRP